MLDYLILTSSFFFLDVFFNRSKFVAVRFSKPDDKFK